METLAAVNALIALTGTISNLVAQAGAVSAIITQAQNEGRTTLTPAEMLVISGADDAARKALVDAITKALAK